MLSCSSLPSFTVSWDTIRHDVSRGRIRQDLVRVLTSGIDAECLVGGHTGRSHYTGGWPATGTLGTFGTAAGHAACNASRQQASMTARCVVYPKEMCSSIHSCGSRLSNVDVGSPLPLTRLSRRASSIDFRVLPRKVAMRGWASASRRKPSCSQWTNSGSDMDAVLPIAKWAEFGCAELLHAIR